MLPAAHMRIALDGEAYSYPEFIIWYGQDAQTMWNCAVESESHTFGKLLQEAETEVARARAAEDQAASALAAIDAKLHEDIRRIREMFAAYQWSVFTEGNDDDELCRCSSCSLCRGVFERCFEYMRRCGNK